MTIVHERPRTEPTIRPLAARLFASLGHYLERRQIRRQMKQSIGHLSARDLRDIGLTRADVESALLARHWEAPERALARARRQNSGNW